MVSSESGEDENKTTNMPRNDFDINRLSSRFNSLFWPFKEPKDIKICLNLLKCQVICKIPALKLQCLVQFFTSFIAPEMVKRSLDNMKPAALVAKPLKAFNKETTTGMSAPPIGNTMLTPKKPQKAVLAKRQA